MPRPALLLVPLLLAATAAASLVAWQEHRQLDADSATVKKVALLASENDTLRDALAAAQLKAADAQNVLRRSQIERDVSSIRQLPFTGPVVYDVLDRAGIRQVVAGKLSAIYTDQQLRDVSTGLSAFGLLPPNFPLKQTYINLLGEQIAAFYDQHQHKLFMFQDASLENAQNRVILAHELTHALQDQNFGLLKLPIEIRDNDDRAAAASALIEGDATLVMSQYMAKDLTWRTFADTITFSATQSMEQIRKAPRYLREMLVFPYIKGEQFCAAVYERGGFPALSAAYANPPSSTAQILHPEKYFAESREDPIPVSFADATFNGEKPLDDNVLGEMGCRILFSQYMDSDTADQIAAGWRGDRYLVFDQGKSLIWASFWRSSGAASAAFGAIDTIAAHLYHGGMEVTAVTRPAWGVGFQAEGGIANEVVFILAPDKESQRLLIEKFAGAPHG
jgi:hypothetical protein